MNRITGKIIGTLLGLLFGGPMTAIIGFVLGHLYDSRPRVVFRTAGSYQQRAGANPGSYQANPFDAGLQQSTFIIGVVVLGAKMAKADGAVTRMEIEAFRRAFNITDQEAAKIGHMFDQARASAEGYEPYALRLAQVFRNRPEVLETILSGLFTVAGADSGGVISVVEADFLKRIAVMFGFSLQDFLRIAARAGARLDSGGERSSSSSRPTGGASADDSFMILGIAPTASDDEVKKAYRTLIRTHHPDKLIAQGLPPEMIKQANEKMKRINAAYAEICKQRGIK
jgi:DnaJ like chaperone protein